VNKWDKFSSADWLAKSSQKTFETRLSQKIDATLRQTEIPGTLLKAVTCPSTNVFDFALLKDFPVRERANLQFRWEVFNLFHHALFGAAYFQSEQRFGWQDPARSSAIHGLCSLRCGCHSEHFR